MKKPLNKYVIFNSIIDIVNRTVTITYNHKDCEYSEELQFVYFDEWKSFKDCEGNVYDIHLLLDVDTFSVSIYDVTNLYEGTIPNNVTIKNYKCYSI